MAIARTLGLLALPVALAGLAHGSMPAEQAADIDPATQVGSGAKSTSSRFRRIASFPVFLNTDVSLDTAAEIVAAADDGHLLIYTDSLTGNVGFIDITDPYQPAPAGALDVGGEPTSVAVRGDYALVAVNTSPSFTEPSGHLQVIDIDARKIVRYDKLGFAVSLDLSPQKVRILVQLLLLKGVTDIDRIQRELAVR